MDGPHDLPNLRRLPDHRCALDHHCLPLSPQPEFAIITCLPHLAVVSTALAGCSSAIRRFQQLTPPNIARRRCPWLAVVVDPSCPPPSVGCSTADCWLQLYVSWLQLLGVPVPANSDVSSQLWCNQFQLPAVLVVAPHDAGCSSPRNRLHHRCPLARRLKGWSPGRSICASGPCSTQ